MQQLPWQYRLLAAPMAASLNMTPGGAPLQRRRCPAALHCSVDDASMQPRRSFNAPVVLQCSSGGASVQPDRAFADAATFHCCSGSPGDAPWQQRGLASSMAAPAPEDVATECATAMADAAMQQRQQTTALTDASMQRHQRQHTTTPTGGLTQPRRRGWMERCNNDNADRCFDAAHSSNNTRPWRE